MSEQSCDVLIIGGGPGGSTAGRALALAGHKTVLLDRAEFPRLKVCAGWITPAIFNLLELSPSDYTGTLQRFQSGSVEMDGRYYETHFPKTASFGIIRKEFDHFLLQRAISAGVDVRQSVRIKEITRQNGSVNVALADGTAFKAKLVIGAGGTHCPVARQWGEKKDDETIIVATESETKIGSETLRKLTPYYGTTELFPEDDFYGYAWYVTKGDWVNIGIGRFQHRTANLNHERERFVAKLRNMGRLTGIEDVMVPFSGHSYKLYDEVPRRKSGDKFLLIGDAAGFATKWAGEGIKPAVHSALLAARVADRAIRSGQADDRSLHEYTELCNRTFGVQAPTISDRIMSAIPERLKVAAARKVCTSPRLRKKFIFETAFGFEPVDF